MTTIDLGELTRDAAPPPMPLDVPRLRRVALALLAVAGVFALAGSAPAGKTGVRQLWATPLRQGEAWSLSADTAYVARFDDKVSAYDLATGELRWSVSAGATLGGRQPQRAGGLLLMPADPVTVSHEEQDGSRYYYETVHTTVALEAATGEERWRVDGEAYPVGDGGTALVANDDEQARTVRLRLIRLTDGAEIWSRPTPSTRSWTPIVAGDRVVAVATVTEDGLISAYDSETGRLRRTTRPPWSGAEPGAQTLTSANGYLVVTRNQVRDTETAIYRAGDLRLLWRTSGSGGYVTACGELLCSVGPTGIAGHDPLTGRTTWELVGMRDLWPAGPGRILVDSDDESGGGYLIDPATGARIGSRIAGRMAYPGNATDVPMYLRAAAEPPDRMAVVAIDPADGGQRTLGAIPLVRVDDICMTTAGYLACVRDDTLDVTAVG